MSDYMHNPLPWEKVDHSWAETSIYDANGDKILGMSIRENATEANQENLEKQQSGSADLILKAVTHHQELVTRLYNLKNAIETFILETAEEGVTPVPGSYILMAVTDADETLKKVIQ